jgi:MerR family transcriptional regulator, heat shock protein HspR
MTGSDNGEVSMNDHRINVNEPRFSISSAAKLLGISVYTLRMYEREGLFISFKKSSRQRRYSRADIQRIEIIRNIINTQKVSINGIKSIYALIPCWEIINCPEKERAGCRAYSETNVLCWMNRKKTEYCVNQNCRTCSVYGDFFQCDTIKTLFKKLLNEKRLPQHDIKMN